MLKYAIFKRKMAASFKLENTEIQIILNLF